VWPLRLGHVHVRRSASATAPAASAGPTAYASRASCASRAAQPLRGGSGPRTRTQERQRHSTSRQRRADRLRLRCASYLYSGHVHIRRRASATAPAASALPTAYASRASCASRAAQPLRGGSGERGDQALSSVRPSGYGLDGPPSVARRVLRSIGAFHFFIPFKGFFCVWRPVQKSFCPLFDRMTLLSSRQVLHKVTNYFLIIGPLL